MKFFTRFERNLHPGFTPVGESLTQQHFKDESDINWIIKHYSEPGYHTLGDIKPSRVPLWGDFSAIPDLRAAHETFALAEASFASLPADIRRRFGNSPLELLAFLQDPSNRAEAEKLGLIAKSQPADPVVPKADTVAAVNTETIQQQEQS